MSETCYCDFGDRPAAYSAARRTARKGYRCDECFQRIELGEQYERAAALYDGAWQVYRTCCRCLDARDYIAAHAPCFCWLHGSMLDDARDTLEQYGHHSAGFYIGGMKRVLRAERHRSRLNEGTTA